MRVHRLISILLLVEAKGKIKAKELAARLETSVRTIYRDIDILCEAGIPLTTTTGPEGGIQFMDGYSVEIDDLQKDDIINLYLSGMGIKANEESDMKLKLENTLLKLEKNLPAKYSSDLWRIKNSFYIDDTPWWGKKTILHNMDALIRTVCQSEKLMITYQKIDGSSSVRRVHPYGIVVKRVDWYLVAYCEKRSEIRTFKCERISQINVTNDKFEIPQGFSVEEYWRGSEMKFKNTCAENEKFPVVIKLKKDRSNILKDLEINEIIHDKDYIVTTVNMYDFESACRNIMKYIGYAEILEPKELREYVMQEISSIMANYYNDTTIYI